MKRKSLLFILTALIGIVLFSSLVFDKPSLSDVKKAGFLFIKVPEKISRDHQQQEIMLTDKTVIKQMLPAHPVSKNINELEETIFTILDDNRLNGAITGISVHRVDDGSPLFSYNANTRLLPASNMKIITTIAVLETLGPDYQFTTEIKTDGKLKSGILKGNLYLVGKGDPTLQKKDFDDLAKQLRKQGIEKITGAIIADDSWYDDVRYSQDLNWTDENNYTGSAVSALTASPNDDHLSGSIIVDVFPGKKVGDKPKVRITPETGYITIVNRAKTVAQSEGFSLTTEREHGANKLIVEGDIPVNSSQYHRWRSVWEPTGYALDLFQRSLKEHKIQFKDNKLQIGIAPKNADVLMTRTSQPLKDLIMPFMKLSNNGLGEVFVKEMGKVVHDEGSWDQGLEVIEQTITELDIKTNDVVFRDGSGMSHKNLISPNHFTNILTRVKNKSWFPYFERSFPIAGETNQLVGGTLSHRLLGESTKGNVKAKTGTLKGVSSLSGYVTTKDGINLAFSILMNNYVTGPVIDIQDQIVTVLAEAELHKDKQNK